MFRSLGQQVLFWSMWPQLYSSIIRWRWRWRQKKTLPLPVPKFSHNPPGHTCGLPCCNHDFQEQQLLANSASNQRGCVTVPVISPAELSESNFFMRRRRGVDATTARPLSGGFFTQEKRKKKFLRRNSDGDNVYDSSDDGWVTASADEDLDDDDDKQEEVDDNATLLRNVSKQDGGDLAKPRTLRFTRDTSIMAPEPCPEMAGVPRAETWQETPTLLRHRPGGRLEPWEAVRQRRIALPDTPHTAHSVMFLNHQPGETSDFTDTLHRHAKGEEKPLEAPKAPEGEDKKVDRFPMQFGQWDGVEGYSSGTLPSARNIVDGCRRREEEEIVKGDETKESEGKMRRQMLYKTRGKGARPNRDVIKTPQDQQSEATSSSTSSDSKPNSGGIELGVESVESARMKSLTSSLESLKSQTNTGVRRRSGNCQLPPVPPQDAYSGSRSSIGSPPTSPPADDRSGTVDPAPLIEEDVESLAETSSLYDDHVYDVPSEVRARAESSAHQSETDDVSFNGGIPKLDKPDFPDAPQLERKDSLEEVLPKSPSDTSLFDTNSLAYNFYPSKSGYGTSKTSKHNNVYGASNTDSYIYNGSLLSVVSSDSDTGSALYYHRDKPPSDLGKCLHDDPAAILRNKLKAGDGSIYGRPIIFMMGGKPVVFSESSPNQTDNESVMKDSASMTFREGHDLQLSGDFQPQPLSMPVGDCVPLTVDVGEPDTLYRAAYCDCEECEGYGCSLCPDGSRSGPVTLDPSTKLKLWDLRLICLNREENQYSTYPPRRPTLDDRGVGPVDAADSLYNISSLAAAGGGGGSKRASRVLRHRSDVSTDQYVTRKINRLLRAPVLTRAELPPMPSEVNSPVGVADSCPAADRASPDFPTAGLRSLYRSFLEGVDLASPSPREDAASASADIGFAEIPSVPACLNPYKSFMASDAKTEAPTWPALFANKDDNIELNSWRNFFTDKISQASHAWPGLGTDEDAIISGCPKPLPVNWPFGAESNAVKAGIESGDETDDSVYIYKPLGFSGMYEWGRGRGRPGGEDSSSSNVSGDDASRRRNHHYCKRRRNHHGDPQRHRSQRHLSPAADKSHVDSLLVRKKASEAAQKGHAANKDGGGEKQRYHNHIRNSPNVAHAVSDGDEDSPAYDSSSIYNASIRSGSSSMYYGGASNLSTSTSHSNFHNITSTNSNIHNITSTNSNTADGNSGSSSSDSNPKSSLTPRDSSRSLVPGLVPGSGKSRQPGTDRRGSQVIWGDASIVDWRRQAAKFRENNFITLIL
ncbi:hypothetical protein ElyMa_004164400 [Elysia marginata]|uniref:Uncharacterized protein n=1 Tax=Elysia marginata TaxID=1093978 RepID=A0AAV4GJ63_9GAST|nr:hypothetical protein ElyMa_004164400 [Elysia marginata]